MEFKIITCKECNKERKVRVGSEQHNHLICGECWEWGSEMQRTVASKKQEDK